MGRISCIVAVLLFASWGPLYAAKPVIGIASITSFSPREERFALYVQEHLDTIIHATGIFDRANSALLRDQLARFSCDDERCLLSFAADAGLSVLVGGSMQDRGDHMLFSLRAYCADTPYEGKIVYRYTVKVPLYSKHSAVEYSYICEEQAGHFMAGFLKQYRRAVMIDKDAGGSLAVSADVSGSYDAYRASTDSAVGPVAYARQATVRLFRGKVIGDAGNAVQPGDFIFQTFNDKARFISDFYYGRKKEIVFTQPRHIDALYMLLATGPAAALMPVVAPFFGYYRTADWTGLALWGLNLAPYLYFEINGFVNYPDQFRRHKKDVSRQVMTQWHFAWYFAFAGGASLFVDAFAREYLKSSADFIAKRPFMGNALCAGYLALITGGGGHFYRGHRFWGYFYFHVNNALLYLIINEFSPGERYDRTQRRYVRERINRTRGGVYAGLFCAVKVAEVVHAVLIRDRIRGGEVVEESASLEPVVYSDEEGLNLGARFMYRF